MKQKGIVASLKDFAAEYKKYYYASILFAILGVACSMIPYFLVSKIIINLIDGIKDFNVYLIL